MLSVIIPAYNEALNLPETIREVEAGVGATRFNNNYEIIIVDDHSGDNTLDVVMRLGNPRVSCIRLSRRSGSHVALRAGLHRAAGNPVICISADGQDDTDTFRHMIEKWEKGAHIVWALRITRQEAFSYKISAMLFYKLLSMLTHTGAHEIDLSRADFYLLDRKVADAVNSCPERNTSLFGLIVWTGFKQDCVDYQRKPRRSGKSNWNFRSRMRLAKDWIFAFSGIPLKIISVLGFITAGMGILYALFLFFYALFGRTIPGWAESVILSLVSNGVQLIMLGVVGEYLWRALDETRRRPLYFVESSTMERDSGARDKQEEFPEDPVDKGMR